MSDTSFQGWPSRAFTPTLKDRWETGRPGSALDLLSGTRREILVLLRRHGPTEVHELAPLLDLSASAARQQLALLKAQGLVVEHSRNGSWPRGSAGRPSHRFSLAPAAEHLFFSDYENLAWAALGILSDVVPGGLVDAVANRYFERLMLPERGNGPVTKADAQELAEALCRAGFDAEVESHGPPESVVSLHSCPIAEIALRFPAFCAAERAAMVACSGGADVKRVEYKPIGDRVCAYTFTTAPAICAGPPAPAAETGVGASRRPGEDRHLAYSRAG